MGDDKRKNMTVDEFDLMVRAIHRAYAQNPGCISTSGSSLYYSQDAREPSLRVSIYISTYFVWPTLEEMDFEVKRPRFWSFKANEKFNNALAMVEEMRDGKKPDVTAEHLICKYVPLAKDIIAERALVGDHGNKTSNSST